MTTNNASMHFLLFLGSNYETYMYINKTYFMIAPQYYLDHTVQRVD